MLAELGLEVSVESSPEETMFRSTRAASTVSFKAVTESGSTVVLKLTVTVVVVPSSEVVISKPVKPPSVRVSLTISIAAEIRKLSVGVAKLRLQVKVTAPEEPEPEPPLEPAPVPVPVPVGVAQGQLL